MTNNTNLAKIVERLHGRFRDMYHSVKFDLSELFRGNDDGGVSPMIVPAVALASILLFGCYENPYKGHTRFHYKEEAIESIVSEEDRTKLNLMTEDSIKQFIDLLYEKNMILNLDMDGNHYIMSKRYANWSSPPAEYNFDIDEITDAFCRIYGNVPSPEKLAVFANTFFDEKIPNSWLKSEELVGKDGFAKDLSEVVDSIKVEITPEDALDYLSAGLTTEQAIKAKTCYVSADDAKRYSPLGFQGDLLGMIILKWIEKDETIENPTELIDLFKDKKGNYLFTFHDFTWANGNTEWLNDLPFSYFHQVCSIEGLNCIGLDHYCELEKKGKLKRNTITLREVHKLHEEGKTVDFVNEMLKKSKQIAAVPQLKFNTVGEGMAWLAEYDVTLEQLDELMSLKNRYGKPLFGDCMKFRCLPWDKRDIEIALSHGIDFSYINNMLSIKGEDGKHLIETSHQLLKLFELGITKEMAQEMISRDMSYPTDWIYEKIFPGIHDISGRDSEKPNALIIFGSADWLGTFIKDEEIDFVKRIMEAYDVVLKVASREEEVYEAISVVPKIELPILSGHGVSYALSLGENDLRVSKRMKNEKYTIDFSDKELKKYLQLLPENARFFVFSCSSGLGYQYGRNLVNFIAKMVPGMMVIGMDGVSKGVDIINLYPFQVSIAEFDANLFVPSGRGRSDIAYYAKYDAEQKKVVGFVLKH